MVQRGEHRATTFRRLWKGGKKMWDMEAIPCKCVILFTTFVERLHDDEAAENWVLLLLQEQKILYSGNQVAVSALRENQCWFSTQTNHTQLPLWTQMFFAFLFVKLRRGSGGVRVSQTLSTKVFRANSFHLDSPRWPDFSFFYNC